MPLNYDNFSPTGPRPPVYTVLATSEHDATVCFKHVATHVFQDNEYRHVLKDIFGNLIGIVPVGWTLRFEIE